MDAKKYVAKFRAKKFGKKTVIIGGVIVVICVAIAFKTSNDNEKEAKAEADAHPKIVASEVFNGAVKPSVTNAEVVTRNMTDYINNQKAVNEQLANRLQELESQNQLYQQQTLEAESNALIINDRLVQLTTQKAELESAASLKPPKPVLQIIEDDINSDTDDSDNITPAKATDSNKSADKPDNAEKSPDGTKPHNVSTYIPSNTFAKGVLVSAISANTGGNASTDPSPMLIRITDFAQLPNKARANIKSCMVGASGFGDLSTERVKARLTNLSCVLKNGQALDIPVDGYISGEDARAGVRGMLVQHSGSLVAKAALAGFIQGIGQIGQAMGQTQTITPLGGVTTTVSPQQALVAGAGSGVSQAGSTLSQYYLSQLQAISPSIEVSAGRHITVIFTHGIELNLPINNQSGSSNASPLPIRN